MAGGNFIGGKWTPARSGATDQVLEPATGELLDEVASSDEADVNDAVAAAARSVRRVVATRRRASVSRC